MDGLIGGRRSGCRESDNTVGWLRSPTERSIFGAVLGHALVVVADAHLGVAPSAAEEGLLAFLEAVPSMGDCLLVNGDLFDFWFSYSRVIPRRGFHVAASLARVRQRMPVLMVGGNHDRWGGDFWHGDLGLQFEPYRLDFQIGTRQVAAIHGDGVAEPRWRATLLHRLINHRLTAAVYRTLHPEIGFRLVDLLSPRLGNHSPTAEQLAEAAARQREWAKQLLQREPHLGLIIMGHTHQAEITDLLPGRQYLNPGAWFDGFRYALVTEAGAALCRFNPTGPLPPAPDGLQ
jgi:UDP-2,3-diacylglucosamine hydrolase